MTRPLVVALLTALLTLWCRPADAGSTIEHWDQFISEGLQVKAHDRHRVLTLPFASAPEDEALAESASSIVYLAMLSSLRAGEGRAFGQATVYHVLDVPPPTSAAEAERYATELKAAVTIWARVYRVGADAVVQPFALVRGLDKQDIFLQVFQVHESITLDDVPLKMSWTYRDGVYTLPPFVLSGASLARFKDERGLSVCAEPRPCPPDPSCAAGASCSERRGSLGTSVWLVAAQDGWMKIRTQTEEIVWLDLREVAALTPALRFCSALLKAIRGDSGGALKDLRGLTGDPYALTPDGQTDALATRMRTDALLIATLLSEDRAYLDAARRLNPTSPTVLALDLLRAVRDFNRPGYRPTPETHPTEWAELVRRAQLAALYLPPSEPLRADAQLLVAWDAMHRQLSGRSATCREVPTDACVRPFLSAIGLTFDGPRLPTRNTDVRATTGAAAALVEARLDAACKAGDRSACIEAESYAIWRLGVPVTQSGFALRDGCSDGLALACGTLAAVELSSGAEGWTIGLAHLERAAELGSLGAALALAELRFDVPDGQHRDLPGVQYAIELAITALQKQDEPMRTFELAEAWAARFLEIDAVEDALSLQLVADRLARQGTGISQGDAITRLEAHAALALQRDLPLKAAEFWADLASVQETLHGRESVEVARALSSQAAALACGGRHASAEALMDEVVHILRSTLGRRAPETKQAKTERSLYADGQAPPSCAPAP